MQSPLRGSHRVPAEMSVRTGTNFIPSVTACSIRVVPGKTKSCDHAVRPSHSMLLQIFSEVVNLIAELLGACRAAGRAYSQVVLVVPIRVLQNEITYRKVNGLCGLPFGPYGVDEERAESGVFRDSSCW